MSLQRPDASTNNCYKLMYCFDSPDHQLAWKNSAQRTGHMKLLKDIFFENETYAQNRGDLIGRKVSQAPEKKINPHKMTLVLIAVVFSVLFPLNTFFGQYIAELPLALRIFSIVLCQVLLMNYVIMPPLLKRLYPWLTR